MPFLRTAEAERLGALLALECLAGGVAYATRLLGGLRCQLLLAFVGLTIADSRDGALVLCLVSQLNHLLGWLSERVSLPHKNNEEALRARVSELLRCAVRIAYTTLCCKNGTHRGATTMGGCYFSDGMNEFVPSFFVVGGSLAEDRSRRSK